MIMNTIHLGHIHIRPMRHRRDPLCSPWRRERHLRFGPRARLTPSESTITRPKEGTRRHEKGQQRVCIPTPTPIILVYGKQGPEKAVEGPVALASALGRRRILCSRPVFFFFLRPGQGEKRDVVTLEPCPRKGELEPRGLKSDNVKLARQGCLEQVSSAR